MKSSRNRTALSKAAAAALRVLNIPATLLLCAHTGLAQTPSPSGTIITIAGTGTAGFSGDNGQAIAAMINFPAGLSIGRDGDIYFADSSNLHIRKIDLATRNITTVAGDGAIPDIFGSAGDGGQATSAQIGNTLSVAIDPLRDALYLGDIDLNRIRKVNLTTGIIENFAGTGLAGFGFDGDGGPAGMAKVAFIEGVAVGPANHLYIADTGNFRVRKVDGTSTIISTLAGNGDGSSQGDGTFATAASLSGPVRVAADGAGNVYIMDNSVDSRVRRVNTADSIISTVAGGGSMTIGTGPATSISLGNTTNDVSVNSAGTDLLIAEQTRLFHVNLTTGQLTVLAGTGSAGFGGDGGPATGASFNSIRGVTFTPAGEVILSDTDNHRIRYIVPDSIRLVGSAQTELRLPYISALSGDFIVTNNASLTLIDAPALTSIGGTVNVSNNASGLGSALSSVTHVGGSIDVTDNDGAETIDLSNLGTAGGSINVIDNDGADTVDLSNLGIVGGSINVTDNDGAETIDLSNLGTASGSIDVTDNDGAETIDLGSLTTVSNGGGVSVTNNTSALTINLSALQTVGGDVTISGNDSVAAINLDALTSVGGSIDISDNIAATSISAEGVTTVPGSVNVSGNGDAGEIDLGELANVGGDVNVSDNGDAGNIDLGELTNVGGDLNVSANGDAGDIDLGNLADVGGDMTAEGNASVGGGAGLLRSSASTDVTGALKVQTAGTVLFNGNKLTAGSVELSGGGKLLLASSGGSKVLRTSSISIEPATASAIDLADNSMILDYATSPGTLEDDLRQHILAGRITSSSATASQRLGYGDNALLNKTNFAGEPVDATTMLIGYTFAGDTDLDSDVDIDDLLSLATHWQATGVWTGGDFDYNGLVDANDLGLLASNWNSATSGALADALLSVGLPPSSVPEPGTACGLVLCAAAQLTRARRRSGAGSTG